METEARNSYLLSYISSLCAEMIRQFESFTTDLEELSFCNGKGAIHDVGDFPTQRLL